MNTLTIEQVFYTLKFMRYKTLVPDNRKALDIAIDAVENWNAVMERMFDR